MSQPQDQQLDEEGIKSLPIVMQIMSRMHKSQHVQDYLDAIRNELILERAHQKLNWKPEAIYEAAAASGFSHGQLILITQLCDLGHVIKD